MRGANKREKVVGNYNSTASLWEKSHPGTPVSHVNYLPRQPEMITTATIANYTDMMLLMVESKR